MYIIIKGGIYVKGHNNEQKDSNSYKG